MTQPLCPMTLGEILDRTFKIYRSRFLVFAVVAAIHVVAIELIHAGDFYWLHLSSLVHPPRQPGIFLWRFIVGLAFYHLSSLVGLTLEPALIKLASASILGDRCSITDSLRLVANRWRGYLGVASAKLLVQLVAPEVLATSLAIVELLIADFTGHWGGDARWEGYVAVATWLAVGIGLFLWVGACTSLTVPASALETLRAFPSLRRSWTLTKGTRARICLTWLAVYVSLWILTYGLEFLLGQTMYFAGQTLHIAATMRSLYNPAVFLLSTAIYAILGPIYPIAVTLFYYDQRIRLEGYDIERMMAAAGLNPTAPPAPGAPVSDAQIAPPGTPEAQA